MRDLHYAIAMSSGISKFVSKCYSLSIPALNRSSDRQFSIIFGRIKIIKFVSTLSAVTCESALNGHGWTRMPLDDKFS